MADYIEREAVLNILASKNAPWDGYQKVSELPVVDVQPVKHGKWEVGDISYRYPSGVHYCSVCDYIDPFSTGSMHYCPNCGARMDGET